MVVLKEATLARLRGELTARPADTLVSIIMPAWNRVSTIGRAIESVLNQSYPNWELLVVDDGSTDGTVEAVEALSGGRGKVRCLRIAHGGVSAARDAGLREARGGAIAYLDSDNRWHPDYLLFMVHALHETGARCAYAAMRIIDEDDGGAVSWRAQRFDLDALLRNNYIDINIFVHRRELFEELGGFDRELRRWVDWDLILRFVVRHYPVEVPAALCDYFRRKRLNQITLEEPNAFKYKVLNKHLIEWPRLIEEAPRRPVGRVSVIIPVLNLPELTRNCVESILKNTRRPDYEIVLVDNGSDPQTARALARLAKRSERVRLVKNFENYMFSLGNNLGVAASTGEYIILLNNDTRVTPGWMDALVIPFTASTEIGMTGPKLLYGDGTVQAAGLAFPPNGKIPYHIYRGFPGDAPCVNSAREFQALTAACVAMRAADYIALGGLDPLYVNGCEDLDLCFRMRRQLGKRVLYMPESVVYHLESKTPGRSQNIHHNRLLFVERWGDDARPDDADFYAADGYAVLRHVKRGNDPDGPTASYVAEVQAVAEGAVKPPAAKTATGPRILVVKPSGIGNMVMFRPAMRALRSHLPQARITVACYKHEAEIIDDLADEVIRLVRKDPVTGGLDKNELESHVPPGLFDMALYPPFTNLSAPTPHLQTAIPEHVCHPGIDFNTRHEVLHNLDVVRLLGWEGEAPEMDAPVDNSAAARHNIPQNAIGIHCGASSSAHMQKKKWPARHWSALLDLIPEEHPVVFLGGPGEEAEVEEVVSGMRRRNRATTQSLVGRLTLREAAGVIRACRLFLSNDSGLMHLAAAVKTPVIGIFGPTLPAKNAPWGDPRINRAIQVDVPCGPCYGQPGNPLNRCSNQICLANIAPERVFSEIQDILGHAEIRPPMPGLAPKIQFPRVPEGCPFLLGPLIRRTYLDLYAPSQRGECLLVGVVDDAEADLLKAKGLHVTKADLYPRNRSILKLDLSRPPRKLHGAFDMVVAFDVLEHIPDDHAAARGIYDMLRAGGTALIHVPGGDINAPLDENDRKHGHERHGYTENQAKDLVLGLPWKEARYLKTSNEIEMRAYHMAGEGRVEESIKLLRTSPFDGALGRAHLFVLGK